MKQLNLLTFKDGTIFWPTVCVAPSRSKFYGTACCLLGRGVGTNAAQLYGGAECVDIYSIHSGAERWHHCPRINSYQRIRGWSQCASGDRGAKNYLQQIGTRCHLAGAEPTYGCMQFGHRHLSDILRRPSDSLLYARMCTLVARPVFCRISETCLTSCAFLFHIVID